MSNLKVRKEFTKKVADLLLKGEKINKHFFELICNEEISIKEIADQVLKTRKGKREFKTIKGVICELTKVVVKTKDPFTIFSFAEKFVCNTELIAILSKGIIKTGNIGYMTKFATTIKNAPLQQFVDEVCKIRLKEGEEDYIIDLYNFIKDINGVNSEVLLERILEKADISDIVKLAKETKNKKLCYKVLEYGDAENIYELAKTGIDIPIEEITDAIIKVGNAYDLFLFARDIPEAPIDVLLNALLLKNDARSLKCFAYIFNDELNDRLDEITHRMIQIGNSEQIFDYAISVNNLSIDKMVDAIIATEDSKYILNYAKKVQKNSKAVAKLCEAMIQYGKVADIYYFAKEIKGADKEALIKKICESGNEEYIYRVALNIEEAPLVELRDAIIKTGKPTYIFKFAKNIKHPLYYFYDDLCDAILEVADPCQIILFAKEIEYVDVDKFADAIIQTKNPRYIYSFAEDVPKAPIKKLIMAIENLD